MMIDDAIVGWIGVVWCGVVGNHDVKATKEEKPKIISQVSWQWQCGVSGGVVTVDDV